MRSAEFHLVCIDVNLKWRVYHQLVPVVGGYLLLTVLPPRPQIRLFACFKMQTITNNVIHSCNVLSHFQFQEPCSQIKHSCFLSFANSLLATGLPRIVMDQAFPLPLVKFCSSALERDTASVSIANHSYKEFFLVQVLQLTVTSNIVGFVSWVHQLVLY